MSYVNRDEKAYVITYKELFFTLFIFSVILFVLYPKDLLKEQILSEQSNYDLSMLYLKNLLQHSPEDESLMLILAEQSLRSGKKDLSLRLLSLLLKSKNKQHREKATLLSYELQKENYYYLESKESKREQKKLLRELFIEIYIGKMYDLKELERWYEESMFVDVERATYFFLQKKIQREKSEMALLEQAYYLARSFHYQDDALHYLQGLQRYDRLNRDKWILDEYHTYVDFREFTKAEKLLKKYAPISKRWKSKLAEFYLMQKEYVKSSETYRELLNDEQNYKDQRAYFYKSVRALQAGNRLQEAAQMMHRYENVYLHDIKVRKFMLKTYMATGNLNYASALSNKILSSELR